VLSKDVQIVDMDASHVEHLGSMLRRGRPVKPDGMILFYEENRVLHAIHTRTGPKEIRSFEGPRRLESVARAENVDFVVALERGALRRIAAGAQSRIRWDDPLTLQALALFTAFDKENSHTVHIYPAPKAMRPRPDAWMARWAKRLLRREQLYAVIVYDEAGEDVWFSMLTRWKDGECILLTTTDSLHPFSLKGTPEARRNRATLERIREVWGPATGALFMDRTAFAFFVAHDRPLTALREMLQRGWAQARPIPFLFRVVLWVSRWTKW
jgi:hypothetical protein